MARWLPRLLKERMSIPGLYHPDSIERMLWVSLLELDSRLEELRKQMDEIRVRNKEMRK